MCLFFSFNYPTPEFKNDKMKHNDTVNSTSQIGRRWSSVTPKSFWPISWNRSISYHKKYLKMHLMPEPFISIDNKLQRKVRLNNIDRLSHDTAFWNLHFCMPNVIFEEIIGIFHVITVSVLSNFIATAYGILWFTAKIEIKYKLTLNLVTLSAACFFIHVN